MNAKRAHILYFVTEDWFFCSHFIERAIAARQAGYQVSVLTRVRAHGDRIRAEGFKLIPLEIHRKGLNPFRELSTILEVARIYRREQPDLVHHFALKPIIYGTLASWLAAIKHCVNAPVGMGFVFSSSSRLARLIRPIMQLSLRALLNPPGSRVVFENADDLAESIKGGLVRPKAAVLIRGAGVDTLDFQPRPEPEGIPKVVLVARMLWEKGISEFVEAARRLRARHIPARLLLVGAPDPENPAAIPVAQLQAWAEENVVEWWGQRSDVAEILADSHIVCLPSYYREGLPKALLEALAAGRPVVATDAPGCREAVRHGDNGFLVPDRDPEALTNALATLLGDPALRQRMGASGRRRAETEFASPLVCEATLGLYRELLTDEKHATLSDAAGLDRPPGIAGTDPLATPDPVRSNRRS
ncbi:MAG: glycosyltransferase family 4 protein [Candidatus Competibacter denitrificans]